MNARYYSGRMGRFISQDPMALYSPEKLLGDPQSLNSYAYARNNPMRYVDPTGEEWEDWNKIFESIARTNSDFITSVFPIASDIRDQYEYDYGRDLITNRVLTKEERDQSELAMVLIGSISGNEIRWGSKVEKGIDGVVIRASESLKNIQFGSFKSFKNAAGKFAGRQWHHLVEQNPLNKANFTPRQLQNWDNLVSIPTSMHKQISGFYSRRFQNYGRFRDFISTLDFPSQVQIGQKVLDNVINGKAPGDGLGF